MRTIQNVFLGTYEPARITRAVEGIRLLIPRTELFKKSVYIGSKEWNNLHVDIRNIIDLIDFKKEIMRIF